MINNEFVLAETSNSISLLLSLSKDKDWHMRWRVAKNSNTPIDILIDLSKDEMWCVRFRVTQNPNTPIEVLIQLSKDKYNDVSEAAIKARADRIALLK